MDAALALLADGKPARLVDVPKGEEAAFRALNLLTAKPILYVANVDEASAATGNRAFRSASRRWRRRKAPASSSSRRRSRPRSPSFPTPRRHEFLATLGLDEPGLDRLIRAGYALLGLITFFTAGPKEVRAWTIPKGARAPQAAGAIHTDFEKGFIRAQTIAYDDFVRLGGEQAAKEAGKARDEGKDYVVADGDVMLFKFNV